MSSNDLALSIRGISKCYTITHQADRDTTGVPGLGQRIRSSLKSSSRREQFWALRDVSLDVAKGDVVGVIGKNGAGKSTLLKILSRITEPTSGEVDLYGRTGSLLEVGTGFHPELTGRENVFLNGAILGMRRHEILAKFDEIVEFSGVEKFLDTPVKRYSSGMYVRLAFAVAAHLDPEILIVDEVLAVGDAEFQRKCLGKIRDVAGNGRTVLFVSHNLSVVSAICTRAVLMAKGTVALSGNVNEVVSRYHALNLPDRNAVTLENAVRTGLGNVKFASLDIDAANEEDDNPSILFDGGNLSIRVMLECVREVTLATVAVIIYDPSGFRLIDVNTAIKKQHISMSPGDRTTIRFDLQRVRLRAGSYPVGLWVGRHGIENYDDIEFAASFEVAEDQSGSRQSELYPGPYTCVFSVEIDNQPLPFAPEETYYAATQR